MTDLRYPVGKFHFDGPPTEEQKKKASRRHLTKPQPIYAQP